MNCKRKIKFLWGIVVFIAILFAGNSYAQLVINEVSQGPSATQEYVEMVVTGATNSPPACGTVSQCVDLRLWMIDDNNGWHAGGSGTGIASGVVRFTNDPFWSCIPVGTIILVYKNTDKNSAIPADDLTDSNNDCAYIIPINSTLFERYTTSPTASGNDSLYKPNSWTWTAEGSWSPISMANTNDSFHLIAPGDTNKPAHAVSWGNNTNSTVISFSGSASGRVYYMSNGTDNNPRTQSNWTNGAAGGAEETPGVPNNAANTTWINGLTNNCSPLCCPKTPTFVNTNVACDGACIGAVDLTVSGGEAPYTFAWTTGASTEDLSSLCAGTYTVTVTDANGCDTTFFTTITNPPALALTTNGSLASCQCPCPGAVWAVPSGGDISTDGSYSFSWSTGSSGFFVNGLCAGTYTVTVTDDQGCTITGTQTIP